MSAFESKALFRLIDQGAPTLLLDEGDNLGLRKVCSIATARRAATIALGVY
jgi:hypothetical protein